MSYSEWAVRNIRILKRVYGPFAEKWKMAMDDRVIVSNMYRSMMDGLRFITDDTPIFVVSAVRLKMEGCLADMDEIIERFEGREAV